MKAPLKRLAAWSRGEEAMAALALFSAGQVLARAANGPGPLSLGRIARGALSNPVPRPEPKTSSKEKDLGSRR